jgi:hypothetical protein
MGAPPNRLSVPESSSSTGQPSPASSSAAANRETETEPPSRYVLLKDLDAAIKHLDDQQLDRLVSVALEERTRRKKSRLCPIKVSGMPKPFLLDCRKES